MDSHFLRNLIVILFTKVISAHPTIKYIQTFWCHMIKETFSHLYIWKFPENVSDFFFFFFFFGGGGGGGGGLFKTVNIFETLGRAYAVQWTQTISPNVHVLVNEQLIITTRTTVYNDFDFNSVPQRFYLGVSSIELIVHDYISFIAPYYILGVKKHFLYFSSSITFY